jgi:hypothetical protein
MELVYKLIPHLTPIIANNLFLTLAETVSRLLVVHLHREHLIVFHILAIQALEAALRTVLVNVSKIVTAMMALDAPSTLVSTILVK